MNDPFWLFMLGLALVAGGSVVGFFAAAILAYGDHLYPPALGHSYVGYGVRLSRRLAKYRLALAAVGLLVLAETGYIGWMTWLAH